MTVQRTYWHLEPLQRKPSEYEIVTSKILYYGERGLEVDLPFGKWIAQYVRGSPFQIKEWDRFRDPRETTYTKYTELQKRKEIFVDGLLRSIEDTAYDKGLASVWIDRLEKVLPVLRYPLHGLQMISAYIGQLAPSGRVVIASAMQTADEMRHIQRIAYRMRQLQDLRPQFGSQAKEHWLSDPMWQPLRRAIENLLVTYDFGESFVGLNLILKPCFDQLFFVQFADHAHRAGDDLLREILFSLYEDCVWHREWASALVQLAVSERSENRQVVREWSEKWLTQALPAVEAFAPVFGDFSNVRNLVEENIRAHLADIGV